MRLAKKGRRAKRAKKRRRSRISSRKGCGNIEKKRYHTECS